MQYSTEFCHMRHCDRLRKELDNITTKNCPEQENTEQLICCVPEGTEPQDCTEEKTTFTLTEFKELVRSAQKGDREAINVLCTAFKPLIYWENLLFQVPRIRIYSLFACQGLEILPTPTLCCYRSIRLSFR